MSTRRAAGTWKPARSSPAASASARLATSSDFPTLGSPPTNKMPCGGSSPGSIQPGGGTAGCSRATGPGRAPPLAAGASFSPPPGGGFLLAFTNPIALAFDYGHVGMVQQAVQQSHDAGRVGEDFVPLFERPVGREDHRFSFVASVDDFVE